MRIIRLYRPKDHEQILAGDVHIGSILSDIPGFQSCIDYVHAESYRRLILMGDQQESRTIDSPYFTLSEVVKDGLSFPELQLEKLIELTLPVEKQTDVVLLGNHEWDLRKVGNFSNRLAKALNAEYGTMSCVVEVYDEDDREWLMYKMYLHHGFGRITSQAKDFEQQEGNKKARLKLMLRELAGDCLIMAMGHTHQDIIVKPTGRLYLYHEEMKVKQAYLHQGRNSRYINPDQRWYINTGSFLVRSTDKLGYDKLPISGYPERAGYAPMVRAFISIEVANGIVQDVKSKRIGEF